MSARDAVTARMVAKRAVDDAAAAAREAGRRAAEAIRDKDMAVQVEAAAADEEPADEDAAE